ANAYAQDSERRYDFHIETRTLGRALEAFVELTGAPLIYPQELADEGGVNSVKGKYTVEEALNALLRDSEFSGGLTQGGVIVISLNKTARGAEVSKKSKLKRSLFVSAAALFNVSHVMAQDDAGNPVDTMIVTGSRVARTGFDTPTPTTVISSDQIMQTGLVDTGAIVMQNPQISVGLGATNDTFNRDIGSSFINLRGLGPNRTLVLIDGRRRVSGSREGSQVDLGSIPPGMIESIEIITGGASAVYGADAVSGVVNVKLKKDFEGLEATARAGISQHGDAETYAAFLNGGGQFADGKGYASFGISAQESKALKYVDRDYAFGEDTVSFVNNPANTGPADGIPDRILINNAHTIGSAYEPSFLVAGQRYIYDGGLITYDTSNCYNNGASCAGGPYGYNNKERNLRTPSKVFSAISNISYEVAPDIRFVAGVDFSYAETVTNGQSFFDSGLVIQRSNPTLPADVAALMDTNGLTSLTVGMEQEDLLGNKMYNNSRYTFTGDIGFEGTIADRFDWEVFYQYGRRSQNYQIANTRIEARFFEALDAVLDGGEIVCNSIAARAKGCVPVNLFSAVPMTEAEKAYYSYTLQRKVDNQQSVAGFQITGPLVALPAGPLSVAVGGEYRKDNLDAIDDGLAARGELYRTDNGALPVSASTDVVEAFAEAVIPLISDMTLVKSLEVEGALRFSDYSSIGSTLAWKLAGSWAPTEDLRVRVTRSKSVRAPNIIELFGPESRGTLNITNDPCDVSQINLGSPTREANCRAFGVPVGWIDPAAALALTTVIGGNSNLTEETSNSWTIGGVITPRFARGLRLSADYWTIDIEDAVQTLDGNSIVDNCVDSPTINNVFCSLVTRGNFVGLADPYAISRIDLRQVNIGKLSAKGIDFSAAYGLELEDLSGSLSGGLNFNLSLVYLMELEELVDATDLSSLLIEDGEYDDPTWRGRFSTSYDLDNLTVVWNMRYVGSAELDVQRTREFNVYRVPSRLYHDVFVGYEFPEAGISLQAGINNLMNTAPPRLPGVSTGTFDGSLYENVGRNFYLGVTKSF
ncbi:MAG: TonB-dependent receptor, partial [Amphiplicatus sp.]